MIIQNNSIVTFVNDNLGSIRGFVDDKGDFWFFAGKVCDCLKLKNSSKALGDLKEKHLRFGEKIDGVTIRYPMIEDRLGRKQKTAVINEPLLYELIFQSRTEKAFKFQQWVFKEVLPELRKHGQYRTESKLIRRSFTDTIKDSGEQERMKGHAYSNYSVLINKSLGLPNKNNRNSFTSEELVQIAKREDLVRCMVAEGKSYSDIKLFLETLPAINKQKLVNT